MAPPGPRSRLPPKRGLGVMQAPLRGRRLLGGSPKRTGDAALTETPPPSDAPVPRSTSDAYTPMVPPPAIVFALIVLLGCLPLNMVLDAVIPDYDPRPAFLAVGALIALVLGVPIGRYWRNGGGS